MASDLRRADLLKAIQGLGKQRSAARARVTVVTTQLAPLIRDAHELGIPAARIAETSGLSRGAIRKIMGGESPAQR